MKSFLVAAFVLALAVPAHAEGCVPTTSDPEIVIPSIEGPIWTEPIRYVDNDLCQLPSDGSLAPQDLYDWWNGGSYQGGQSEACLFSIWSYAESNSIEGLQRGDEVHDDTCGGLIPSDTLEPY